MENNHPLNKKINQLVDSPDDLVWENIEKELQKKKKRRFIFWMLFAAFSFSILGYLVDNQFSKSNLSPVNSNENSTVNTNNSNESNHDFNKIESKLEKSNSDKNNINDNIEKNNTTNNQDPKKTHQNSNSKHDSKSKIIKNEPKVAFTLKEDSINNKIAKKRALTKKKASFIKKKSYAKKKKNYSKKKKSKTNNINESITNSTDGKVENTSNIYDSVFSTNNAVIKENTITSNINNKEIKKPIETNKIKKKPIKKAQETNEIKTVDQDTLVDREGRRFVIIPFVGFSNMTFNNSYSLLSNDVAYQKPSSELNFQFGVRTRIELAEDVSLTFGVTYYKHSYNNIINYSPNFVWDNNVENFHNVPFTSNELEVKHDIHYLSIPINIEYSIYESKNLHIKTFLGPEFNYLTENTISYKNSNDWIPFANASFLNKAMVNVKTGFIFRQNLTKDWIIELNPELQIPFYMKRKDYFAKPFFYGLTIGTEIKF